MSDLNPELTTVDDVLIIRTDKASDTGLKNGDEVKFTASVGVRPTGSSNWDASVLHRHSGYELRSPELRD